MTYFKLDTFIYFQRESGLHIAGEFFLGLGEIGMFNFTIDLTYALVTLPYFRYDTGWRPLKFRIFGGLLPGWIPRSLVVSVWCAAGGTGAGGEVCAF